MSGYKLNYEQPVISSGAKLNGGSMIDDYKIERIANALENISTNSYNVDYTQKISTELTRIGDSIDALTYALNQMMEVQNKMLEKIVKDPLNSRFNLE